MIRLMILAHRFAPAAGVVRIAAEDWREDPLEVTVPTRIWSRSPALRPWPHLHEWNESSFRPGVALESRIPRLRRRIRFHAGCGWRHDGWRRPNHRCHGAPSDAPDIPGDARDQRLRRRDQDPSPPTRGIPEGWSPRPQMGILERSWPNCLRRAGYRIFRHRMNVFPSSTIDRRSVHDRCRTSVVFRT